MGAGRGLGRGAVHRVELPDGRAAYRLDYVDAQKKRHRPIVAGNRATASKILAQRIHERDLELASRGRREVEPHLVDDLRAEVKRLWTLLEEVIRRGGGVGTVGADGAKGSGLPISDLVEQYLADLRTHAALQTIANTESILKRMAASMELVTVRDVTKAKVTAWRHARLAAGVSHKTVNTGLAYLLAALNLAVRLDQITANPLAGLKKLQIRSADRRRIARPLTDDELGRLLTAAHAFDAAQAARPGQPRLRKLARIHYSPQAPLLCALIGTGTRWTELISTTWGDVDLDAGVLSFTGKHAKNGEAGRIPLDPAVLAALKSLRQTHSAQLRREFLPSERIFLTQRGAPWGRDTSNFRRWLVEMLEQAGIPRVDHAGHVVHVHALRHTFCTRLGRNGVPLKAAQALSRHKTPQMLLNIYQHATIDDARAGIQSLPPMPGASAAPAAVGRNGSPGASF